MALNQAQRQGGTGVVARSSLPPGQGDCLAFCPPAQLVCLVTGERAPSSGHESSGWRLELCWLALDAGVFLDTEQRGAADDHPRPPARAPMILTSPPQTGRAVDGSSVRMHVAVDHLVGLGRTMFRPLQTLHAATSAGGYEQKQKLAACHGRLDPPVGMSPGPLTSIWVFAQRFFCSAFLHCTGAVCFPLLPTLAPSHHRSDSCQPISGWSKPNRWKEKVAHLQRAGIRSGPLFLSMNCKLNFLNLKALSLACSATRSPTQAAGPMAGLARP